MDLVPQLLLIGAVAGVGILHTLVPDHWVPIALIARQRGWTRGETARAALIAGTGHVVSTLIIAIIVWTAGALVAARFGQWIDMISSVALIAFGGWIAFGAWRELSAGGEHGHAHGHGHSHSHDFAFLSEGNEVHGPELQSIDTGDGPVLLSIFEDGVPPRFRVTGAQPISVETIRPDGARQVFRFANKGSYWESIDEIPEPHGFDVIVTVGHDDHAHSYRVQFVEHAHDHGGHAHGHDHGHGHHHQETDPAGNDALYAPLRGETAAMTHVHPHKHASGSVHAHRHDHALPTVHAWEATLVGEPPTHDHKHRTSARTALLLIVGSSPMIEGIPAFFAGSRYGLPLIVVMSLVFAVSTIATYVVLCVASTAGLQQLRLGAVERYGEVLSGVLIAAVGVVFWIWPVL